MVRLARRSHRGRMLSFPAASRKRSPFQRLRRIGIIYLVYAGLMFAGQRRLIFPRQFARIHPGALDGLLLMEHVFLPIEGGSVEALYLRAPNATAGKPAPAVIFAHGNAETIDDWGVPLDSYRDQGISVLIPEFRGFGRSGGSPSQTDITDDYVRFYDALVARPEVDPRHIYFHGRSLGGGVICALAAKRKPAAIILQSTFTRMADLAHRRLLPGFLLRDPFDSLSVIEQLDVPVYIAHGTKDFVIPFAEGKALAAAARHGEFHPLQCTHADCPPDWDAFMVDVGRFLRGVR